MLVVDNLTFSYSDEPVLENISFKVEEGEHLALIGESGSGKSTLLNLIYGMYDLVVGRVFWNETEILGPAHNLIVGYDFMKYVSQEYDLMPFVTVEENVGKYLSNFYPEEKKERTQELLNVVELQAFSNTKVKKLSGGQKQRVALARALAKEPEILLLDEPFSDIDNFKKQTLRRKLFSYLKSNNISCITATHDKDDILGFADEMIVLRTGKMVAKGTPQELYEHPKTELIASFFGEFNIIKSSYLDQQNSNVNDDVLVYANQIKIVSESQFKVKVDQSFFNGKDYLISSIYKNQEILFYHSQSIEKDTEVFLKVETLI